MKSKNISKQILILAWPVILEMMMHTLVWTADTAMVGRLTPAAIAGVNLGAHIMFSMGHIFGALGIGATAMVARHIGAGERDKAEYIGAQALLIGILISIMVGTLLIIGAKPIFQRVVQDPEVIILGTDYLRIVSIGLFFFIPLMIGNAMLRGAGNTVIPLVSAIVANTFNIVGDYVLIFGKFGFPELGVRGAAIATGTAQAVAAMVTLYFLLRGKSGIQLKLSYLFKWDFKAIKAVTNLSIPAGLEMMMNEGSRLVSALWIAQLGTIAYAAHSLAVAAESISFMPGYGFAIAATTLVGQNLGNKDIESADKSAKKATLFAVLLMGSVGILFFMIPHTIMALFSTDRATVATAAMCLRVGAFEQIPIAIGMTASGALKGAGDTKGPFKIALITNLLIRLPLIYMVVFVFQLHVAYVWGVSVIQFIVEASLMTARYKKGSWKEVNVDWQQ
ncbi:putative efflux protein, MATE family [Natronincola peptidivorans]|uniref:Probable multidrug resistance protein NorM n=1 Tax=Natronincola peptidivorans TaxID=426128 RepID=A0A1I0FNH1_9FIRM|nr:MATE family efflux transporter [Natronincola peptidivorans]SET59633.1 putative efflux protein, MATE family [Natronincola peptidivorans]